MAPPCTVWKDAVHSAEGVSMIEGVPACLELGLK